MKEDSLEIVVTESAVDHWSDFEPFGQYRIAGLIGRGGMAELLLAIRETSQSFRQVVALKRVLPGMASVPGFSSMFEEEARIMGRLEHPNIVRVFDFGTADGVLFMAMEYLAGEDLHRIIRRMALTGERMPPRLAAAIARDVAAALTYTHEFSDDSGQSLDLVHRDVSPSNIIVTYQGVTKLIDFGIAKTNEAMEHTDVGTVKGKLAYVAPEVITVGKGDHRIDVYSVGCVLWEMLTGSKLFSAENDAAVINSIVNMPIPDLREVVPGVDETIASIVMKALAKDPNHRFGTARALEEALEKFLEETGGQLSHRQVSRWLVGLVGSERAAAKQDVASGTRLSLSLPKVMTMLNKRSGLWPKPGSNGGKVPESGGGFEIGSGQPTIAAAPSTALELSAATRLAVESRRTLVALTGALALAVCLITGASIALTSGGEAAGLERLRFQGGRSTALWVDGTEASVNAEGDLWVSRGVHVVQTVRNGQVTSTRTTTLSGPLAVGSE